MKLHLLSTAAVLLLQIAPSNAQPAADGFRPLFNGTDLTGWDGNPELWTVEDGCITGKTQGPRTLTHNQFIIWSGGVVKNFELRAKVKQSGKNTGIQYRSKALPAIGKWSLKGYQCDIHPELLNNGMLYEERGRGIMAQNGQTVIADPEARRWLIAAHDPVQAEVSGWHEYTVIANGNHLIHKIDGKVTMDLTDCDEKARSMEGLLAFQLHQGPAMKVQIKDVMLKELADGTVLPFDQSAVPAGSKALGKIKPGRAAGAAIQHASEKPAGAKPNIIVIYTDDHGYADLGCQGIVKDVKTPNIDSIAAAGVRMTDGYITAPQCSPSRCGLMTGQFQGKFGMDNNGSWKQVSGLSERFFNLKTLPDRMKDAGYVTGMAGKSHLGSNESAKLTELGFDKVFFKHSDAAGSWNMNLEGQDIPPQEQPKLSGYHLELTTKFACAFIDRFKDEPFFFYLAYRSPHVPLDAPKKYTDRFPGVMPEERRKALGMISAVDDGVGEVLKTLRKNGLEENTLIFVISDNGAPIGLTSPEMRAQGNGDWPGSLNDPLNGGKGMLIEGGIRTPFVMQWKGTIPAGQVYRNPVSSLDVAATANALAGQPDDLALDGVNLVPYLTGGNAGKPHESLCWRWDGQFAIR